MSVDNFIVDFVVNVTEEAESAAEIPRRIIRWREDPFMWSELAFVKEFRLSKQLTNALMETIRPVIRNNTTYDLQTKTLCALSFFGHGSYQTPVGDNRNINMSQSSVSRCIAEIVDALNEPSVFNAWVRFPTIEEMSTIIREFYRINGFPGIIGCIDCTHVAIVPPASTDYNEKSYINRKNYHSINTQLICDSNLKITNVNARFPGGTHDCHIWNNSNVLSFMEQMYINGTINYHLLGDSGYPLRPWCLTPIRHAVEDSPEEKYTEALTKTRSTIERCNGVLKGRFRCLIKDRVLHYTPPKASKIINACTVLHNMCIVHNLPHPDYSDLDNEQLGMISSEPLPEVASSSGNRTNIHLQQGRAKQTRIVNNFFNN